MPIDPRIVENLARLYLNAHPDTHLEDDPILTPLQTDLTGLPPLLIHTSTGEPTRPQAELLAHHATIHGVDTTLTIYPTPTHNFHVFWTLLPEAASAIEHLAYFIGNTAQARTQDG